MRYSLIGPTYPFRGGLAHFTTLLAQRLRERHRVRFYSYRRQYPAWLFPGNTDPDPSGALIQAECERFIDALDPLTYLRAARNVVADRPDALILQWWTPFWLPLHAVVARAARRAKIPVIYLSHQLVEPDSSPAEWQVARLGLRDADGFVTLNRREGAVLAKEFPGRPVRTSHLPVYDEFPAPTGGPAEARARLGLPQDGTLVLNFGFVRRYKGVAYLIEAMAQLGRPAHLVVAGEFWEPVEEYRAQVERLGLAGKVTLHDRYIPNEGVADYFVAADVLALPYLSGSQSAVAMTAVHYGLPVITTAVGALSETVVDGENGLVVPPADSAALAAALRRYVDEGLSEAMRGAMGRARQRLSWGALVDAIEELTHELTGPAVAR